MLVVVGVLYIKHLSVHHIQVLKDGGWDGVDEKFGEMRDGVRKNAWQVLGKMGSGWDGVDERVIIRF